MKSNIDKLKALFPRKAKVTQQILNSADIQDVYNCTGSKTLKESLKDYSELFNKILWSTDDGIIIYGQDANREHLVITTEERINMMKVTIPTTVTFILSSNIDIQ